MSASTNSAKSKDSLRLWLSLLKTTREIEKDLREKLRLKYGTSLPRFDVMAALDQNRGGIRMSDLASKLMISNGNITGLVGRMVADQLVERVPVATDGRAMLVRLTEQGQALFNRQAKDHEMWIAEKMAILPDEAPQAMMEHLSLLRGMQSEIQ